MPTILSRNWNPRFEGWVVVFDDFPMKYICLFNEAGEMTKPADSIAKFQREEEFQRAYNAHMEKKTPNSRV